MPKSAKAAKVEVEDDDVVMDEQEPTSAQQDQAEDESMDDGGEGEEFEEDEEEVEDVQRVRMLPGATPTAASFEFLNEGHTLGNALRYVIMKNPEVEFCAYAIPHPSEDKMNVRIQTFEGTTAIEALEKGLKDLQDLCDVVSDKFITARDAFVAQSS